MSKYTETKKKKDQSEHLKGSELSSKLKIVIVVVVLFSNMTKKHDVFIFKNTKITIKIQFMNDHEIA